MKKVRLKKTIAKAFALIGIVTLSGSLQAASFDCAKASTATEKMICADEALSSLDEQLAQAYKAASEKAGDKELLKQQQRTWLKEQRNVCKDAPCLATAYQARINVLSETPSQLDKNDSLSADQEVTKAHKNNNSARKKFPLKFKLVEGDSYPLCQPYVDMLNETKYMEYPACERRILPEFKQFSSLDWVELTDELEKVRAIESAIKMKHLSSSRGLDASGYQIVMKGFQVNRKKHPLFVYATKFDIDSDGKDDVIYKYRWGKKSEDHGEEKSCKDRYNFYVYDHAFSEKRPREFDYKGFNVFSLDGDNQYFLFEGKMYHDLWVSSNSGDNNLIKIFEISYKKQQLCEIKS